ncbi:hypothetical protein, partial [Pseudoalteromonas distincta]|uniref:hypothetical protein n=1 Tax=Pseudoalteromonas distincta TaxID=77608 RepID=UPI0034E85417
EVLLDFPEPATGADPYQILLLLLGGAVVMLAFGIAARPPEAKAALLVGVMSVLYATWSTVWGLLLSANWLVSDYI